MSQRRLKFKLHTIELFNTIIVYLKTLRKNLNNCIMTQIILFLNLRLLIVTCDFYVGLFFVNTVKANTVY